MSGGPPLCPHKPLRHWRPVLAAQQIIEHVDQTFLVTGAVTAVSKSGSDHGFGTVFDIDGDGAASHPAGLGWAAVVLCVRHRYKDSLGWIACGGDLREINTSGGLIWIHLFGVCSTAQCQLRDEQAAINQ